MKEKIHFDTPDAKDFVATFRQLTNRHESWKVWSDFVTLTAAAQGSTSTRLRPCPKVKMRFSAWG